MQHVNRKFTEVDIVGLLGAATDFTVSAHNETKKKLEEKLHLKMTWPKNTHAFTKSQGSQLVEDYEYMSPSQAIRIPQLVPDVCELSVGVTEHSQETEETQVDQEGMEDEESGVVLVPQDEYGAIEFAHQIRQVLEK